MGREICNSSGNFLQKTKQCFTSTPSQTVYREVTVLEYVFYSKSLYTYCVHSNVCGEGKVLRSKTRANLQFECCVY